jgi:hypothetical protein
MDHTRLTGEDATAGTLPGLEPLIKRAMVEALKQHAASVTAAAVARGLDEQDLASIAERAVKRELADLAEPAGPYYPTLPEWVQEWLLPLYRRSISGHHRIWCPEWWRHDEAVARLDALWRAWEHLRLDAATGLSAWFRDHADHHMRILLDADGPLKGCDGTHSQRPLDPLPHQPPPAGDFEPDDDFIPSAPIDAPGVIPSHSPGVGRDPKSRRAR